MTDSPDRGVNVPNDSLEDQLKYLRQRQTFMETAVRFLMGLPPTGADVTWQDVINLKVVVDFGRAQVKAEDDRRLRRAKRWSQLVRIVTSLVGAIALWVFKDVIGYLATHIRNLPPFGWIWGGK